MLFWGRYGESSDREHFLGDDDFSQNHSDSGTSIKGRSIDDGRDQSASTEAAQQLLLFLRIYSSERERYSRSAS